MNKKTPFNTEVVYWVEKSKRRVHIPVIVDNIGSNFIVTNKTTCNTDIKAMTFRFGSGVDERFTKCNKCFLAKGETGLAK